MIDRIIANPKILGGKPVVQGTRLSVEFILELLTSDIPEEDILEDYPHLTREDIHACLRYAARYLIFDKKLMSRRSEAKSCQYIVSACFPVQSPQAFIGSIILTDP